MKKTITILLALVMVLSLAACGGGSQPTSTPAPAATAEPTPEPTPEPTEEPKATKEDLLAEAEKADMVDLQNAVYDNKVKAKQDYCNTPIAVTGKAIKIEDNYVIICDSQVCLDAYLSIDDLVKIETQNTITVVGIISDITELEMEWGGSNFKSPHYIMDYGYLVD